MLLTTRQAAERLTLSDATLRRFRSIGAGPRYLRLPSGSIRYVSTDIDAWLAKAVKVSPGCRR